MAVYPTGKYWADPDHHPDSAVLIGFSSIAEADIRPGIEALAQQGRLLMESAQKQHLQRLIDFEFDDDGFIGCYRRSHPEGKTVSRNRLERLGSFVRRRARELLETH